MKYLFKNLLNFKTKVLHLDVERILDRRRHILEKDNLLQGVNINWDHYKLVVNYKFNHDQTIQRSLPRNIERTVEVPEGGTYCNRNRKTLA